MTKGVAYGFLNYGANKEALETELRHARIATGAPSDLELTVSEGVASLAGNLDIDAIRAHVEQNEPAYPLAEIEYVITARYGAPNHETARELGNIFDQVSLSDDLTANLARIRKQPVMEIAYLKANGAVELM